MDVDEDRTRLPDDLSVPVSMLWDFEEAWGQAAAAGPWPEPKAFLPDDLDPLVRQRAARELALIDMEHRLRLGQVRHVADYLRLFPELQDDLEAVRELMGLELSFGSDGSESHTLALSTVVRRDAGDRHTKIGRYLIRGELGSGSFGDVCLAYDPLADRLVALKLPRTDRYRAGVREEFLGEARAAARLASHDNVVPVWDVGEHDALVYIISEFCEGGSLARWQRARTEAVPFRLAARIVAELADGVQHAHDGGVLHRDLKPGNVLLRPTVPGPDGLDFVPRVADFGLARHGDEDIVGNRVHGTHGYMAPEQTGGRAHEIGPATDVYGLGAILYALLTGHPPIDGDRATEVVQRIRTNAPRSVRDARPEIPRDLELIGLRALAKNPADRYGSAGALADDLRCFLAGEPISGSSWWEHARTWPRRRPRQAVGLTLLVVLLIAAYPAYRLQLRLTADRALASLQTWRVPAYPRLLARLDLRDAHVSSRLRALFGSDDPRVKLPSALALSSIDADAREYALIRALDATPDALRTLAPLLWARMPNLCDRLEAELAPHRAPGIDVEKPRARFTPSDRFSGSHLPPSEDGDKRRANAALALILLGRPDPGYGLLRLDPDPQARSFLVHRLGAAGVAPHDLFDRLRHETDVSIRRALILALGEVPDASWEPSLHGEVGNWLLDRYKHDPDAGIHGAIRWLLESWSARPFGVWLIGPHRGIDEGLKGLARDGFGWRVSKSGLTLVSVPQSDGSIVEIADVEVTVGQFRRFDPEHHYIREASPTDEHPMNQVAATQALAFCRWLSAQESLGDGQAYRLPTVSEFLTASRAGARTPRFYGTMTELLSNYAVYSTSDLIVVAPVGSRKPNDLGLFDTMGNVSDLCADPQGSPRYKAVGGSAAHHAYHVVCDSIDPTRGDDLASPEHGFRVARTVSGSRGKLDTR
jgi:Protein kinase domain/Sulfatase-modifying factor enzyme 1